jgi:hypothetical protein
MKIIIPVLFVTIIACCGCVPETYWYNKNNTYLQAREDCWECLYQAQKKANGALEDDGNAIGNPSKLSEAERQKIVDQCMTDKGYKKTWDDKLGYSIRKGFLEFKDKQYNVAGK